MKRYLLHLTLGMVSGLAGFQASAQCPTITCTPDTVLSNDAGACGAVVNYATPLGINTCTDTSDTFFFTGAIDSWVVPAGITNVTIEARGAQGGNNNTSTISPGLGAIMIGDFTVTPGATLSILVGEQPATTDGNGGGGGTFVVDASNSPLIVAGGGGGSSQTTDSPDKHGNITTTGGTGAAGGGTGGTAGNGGNIGASGFQSGAGGGLLTNGADGWTTNTGGLSFLNGGSGGTTNGTARGGFGGGGSGSSYVVGGGGGGYSGGGSGGNTSAGVGGGGASYNAGTNPNNTGGANTGHGMVIISWSTVTVSTVQTAGLPSGSTFPVGVTTNTFKVTAGTVSDSCSFTVTVNDTTKPTVTCPANVNSCDSIVTGIGATTSDNCSGETLAYTMTGATTGSGSGDVSGTVFGVGTTTVQYLVTDASGNKDSCSFDVVVAAPVDVTVTNSDPTLTANNSSATYQWIDCSNMQPITGETGQSFTATANGSYAVIVTEGSCSDTSQCNSVVTIGIGESTFGSQFKVYPNPTEDVLNIQLGQAYANMNLTITTVEGKVVHTATMLNKTTTIDMSSYPRGVYILTFKNDNQLSIHRITKQ
ncbi:MAG: HYR domain-containing protein [Flavobacteriales bacterium]|nr:HYR domain-containing protein [Flavobacteriales bacterium]